MTPLFFLPVGSGSLSTVLPPAAADYHYSSSPVPVAPYTTATGGQYSTAAGISYAGYGAGGGTYGSAATAPPGSLLSK